MLRWSITILLLSLFLLNLASAVRFTGIPEAIQVGQTMQLSIRMGDHDNFKPFDLILFNSSSTRGEVLLNLKDITLVFVVNVTIPNVPDGQYMFAAAEPDGGRIFSRSNENFFIVGADGNIADMLASTVTAPLHSLPSSSSSFPSPPTTLLPEPTSGASQGTTSKQPNITVIILGIICAVVLVLIAVCIFVYLRQRHLRKGLEQPLVAAYEAPASTIPPPPIKYLPLTHRAPTLRLNLPTFYPNVSPVYSPEHSVGYHDTPPAQQRFQFPHDPPPNYS